MTAERDQGVTPLEYAWARDEIVDWAAMRIIPIVGTVGGGSIAAAAFGGREAILILLVPAAALAGVVLFVAAFRLRALRRRAKR